MQIKFYKYEGAGNDFILFDGREGNFEPSKELLSALCDRRFGIGADGAMILSRDQDPENDFLMRYFNADGGEATMCGNGGRCITLFAHHLGIGGSVKRFMAIDGLHTGEIVSEAEFSATVKLQMIDVEGIKEYQNGVLLDTGSPHYVEFVDSLEALDVFARGREIRYSEPLASQGGANINFVKVDSEGEISVRTYERGVEDETYACGTGVTASAIATLAAKQPGVTSYKIHAMGGELTVEITTYKQDRYEGVYLTGGARKVFSGTIETKNFIK